MKFRKKENVNSNMKNSKAKDALILRTERPESQPESKVRSFFSSKNVKMTVATSAACAVLAAALATTIAFSHSSIDSQQVAVKATTPPSILKTPVPIAGSQDAEDLDHGPVEDESVQSGEIPESTDVLDTIMSMDIPFEGALGYGDHNESIPAVQERLMTLSYMDHDEPTDYFGPITQEAISKFQRTYGLEITGTMDAKTYAALMSDGAPEYTVFEGADGTDVMELQSRLYELGYLKASPTGYYGSDTKSAVELFQENNDLTVTGKINVETRELLYNGDVVAMVWGSGDTNENILPYQQRLHDLGYLTNEPDGVYGDATIAAVKRFQDRNSLITDGRLGPQTMTTLMSDEAIPNSLAIGNRGDDVFAVQERLNELDYLTKDMCTSYFGAVTDHAIRAFQKENSLDVDGHVGKQTMAVLMSETAKKAPSGYSQYSNSSSSSSNKSEGSSDNTPSRPIPEADQPSVANLVNLAKSRLGCRYVRGGKGDNKFDCSGFVYWCLKHAGIDQGYLTSYGWRSVGKYPKITKLGDLKAGDVVVFYGHVGLIVSDDDMIDASSTRGCVVQRSFRTSWCKREFICGYRVLG